MLKIKEGNEPLEKNPNIKMTGSDKSSQILSLSSGSYHFAF
jgi:hypothetical protein